MLVNINDYDTIIVDLDFTIWCGNGERTWAKTLSSFQLLDRNIIEDHCGNRITLDRDFRAFAEILKYRKINLGFVTRGGLLDIEFKDQPPVKCLALFKLLHFFNSYRICLWKEEDKGEALVPFTKTNHIINQNTLYIDDTESDLESVQKANNLHNGNVRTLNRKCFREWLDLI